MAAVQRGIVNMSVLATPKSRRVTAPMNREGLLGGNNKIKISIRYMHNIINIEYDSNILLVACEVGRERKPHK